MRISDWSSDVCSSDLLVEGLLFQPGFVIIGIGMWLGLIMAFNVWFVIWPNQKRALGIVEADADAKAKSATTAMIFSRINTLLSIPMLYCMVTQFSQIGRAAWRERVCQSV